MLPGNISECLVISLEIPDDWAIGFDGDAMLSAIVNNLSLLAPGMQLHRPRLVRFTQKMR